MDAVVYTSNTGFTAHYAELLGESASLPVYALDSSCGSVRQGVEVIYLGWLMAGRVQGLRKAARRFKIRAVCAVGMGPCGSQTEEVRRANALGEIPLFVLQGGFDITKLHGLYRFMMNTMVRVGGRKLAEKPDKTPEQADMLDMMLNGGDRVCAENLTPVLDWLNGEK